MLVALPMFLSAWLLVQPAASPAWQTLQWGLAGALSGVCVVFKLPHAPLFICLVLVAIFDTTASRRPNALLRHAIALLLPYTAGVALVLGTTCALLWHQGVLDDLLYTSFVVPFLTLEMGPLESPIGRLMRSLKWFAVTFWPWLMFAVLPLLRVFRRDEPALTRQMLTWLVVGTALICLQVHAFWRYHTFLLFVPAAVLGARGIDLVVSWITFPQSYRVLAPALLSALLALPALAGLVIFLDREAQDFYQALFSSEKVGLEQYRRDVGKDYGWAAEWFEPLRNPDGEAIYSFGNPILHLVTQRKQALVIHGWSWGLMPPQNWQDLPEKLAEAKPAYVFLGHFYRHLFPLVEPQSLSGIIMKGCRVFAA